MGAALHSEAPARRARRLQCARASQLCPRLRCGLRRRRRAAALAQRAAPTTPSSCWRRAACAAPSTTTSVPQSTSCCSPCWTSSMGASALSVHCWLPPSPRRPRAASSGRARSLARTTSKSTWRAWSSPPRSRSAACSHAVRSHSRMPHRSPCAGAAGERQVQAVQVGGGRAARMQLLPRRAARHCGVSACRRRGVRPRSRPHARSLPSRGAAPGALPRARRHG